MRMMEMKGLTPEQLRRLEERAITMGNYATARAIRDFASTYGREVKVLKGRKVPIGTTGVCFWMGTRKYGKGADPWGLMQDCRIGIKTASGEVYWTSVDNVEVLSVGRVLKSGDMTCRIVKRLKGIKSIPEIWKVVSGGNGEAWKYLFEKECAISAGDCVLVSDLRELEADGLATEADYRTTVVNVLEQVYDKVRSGKYEAIGGYCGEIVRAWLLRMKGA